MPAAASIHRNSAVAIRTRVAADPIGSYAAILGYSPDEFIKKSASERAVRCAFHDDHNPSLRVNIEKFVWRCDPCGKGGDAFDLFAQRHRLNVRSDFSRIVQELGQLLGTSEALPPVLIVEGQHNRKAPQTANGTPPKSTGLTIEDFAQAKGFTAEFLADCGISQDKSGLVFHYLLMNGQRAARQRIRLSLNADKRFIWNKAEGRPVPYGLWRLEDARRQRKHDLVLGEGESDTITFWWHGINALGIPGADNTSLLQSAHIAGFGRVLIVRENDHGGEVFEKGCTGRLAQLEFDGEVRVVEMGRAAVKDPNELHLKLLGKADGFASEWEALVELARVVRLPRTGILLTNLQTVMPKRVEWFWKNRFPIANTSLLAGMPGVGKSTLTLDVAARASTGRKFADGAEGFGPADVLIITGEDNIASVMVPRLRALGADMSRIVALQTVAAATQTGEIGQRGFNLSADIPELKKTLTKNPGIKLVIIDPLSSFLGRADAHKEAEMRGIVMTPLFAVAEEHNVAILIVVHLNKGSGSPLQRISGSVGIAGAARMVWACVADPEKPDRSLMLPVKLNLAKDAGGLAYRIVGSPDDPEVATIAWEDGAIYQRVDEVFAEEAEQRASGGTAKLQAAKNLWMEMLADGPRPYTDIEKQAQELHISNVTLRRAKVDLGVKSIKRGYAGRWWASLER